MQDKSNINDRQQPPTSDPGIDEITGPLVSTASIAATVIFSTRQRGQQWLAGRLWSLQVVRKWAITTILAGGGRPCRYFAVPETS
jgi:hypothetical protein